MFQKETRLKDCLEVMRHVEGRQYKVPTTARIELQSQSWWESLSTKEKCGVSVFLCLQFW